MALVDWDDDGDLDVVVGTYEGFGMFLRAQMKRTRVEPAYATRE